MRLILPAMMLFSISLHSQAMDIPAAPDPVVVKTLNDFSIAFEARMKAFYDSGKVDDQFKVVAEELAKLSKTITDVQLPSVEAFALTKDGGKLRWWLAYFFIERGKFDSAAHLYVEDLIRKENRSYVMWKYWEHYYGERKDFSELSRKIGVALMRQFETGNAEYKLVVAELFGKGEPESKLTVEEFKKSINWKIGKDEK